MQKVRLETKDGFHVLDHEIPPCKKMPDVLVWNQRVFAILSKLHERWIYREVSVFTIIDKEAKSK